jgi:O-antigen ligase
MSTVATFSTMVHPHNVVLQALLAWGLVGTSCIALLLGWMAWRIVPKVRIAGGDRVPAFVAMAVLAAYSLFDGTLYHILPLSLFAACAGIVARPLAAIEAPVDPAIGGAKPAVRAG